MFDNSSAGFTSTGAVRRCMALLSDTVRQFCLKSRKIGCLAVVSALNSSVSLSQAMFGTAWDSLPAFFKLLAEMDAMRLNKHGPLSDSGLASGILGRRPVASDKL